MAKIFGVFGGASGKAGNLVFAKVGGIQTIREYNPIVANPRTDGQLAQRARVSLAGQLSKGVTAAAIEGLLGNKRDRRAAFLSNAIKSTSSNAETAGGFSASLNASALVFSVGSVNQEMMANAVAVTRAESGRNVFIVATTINPVVGSEMPKGKIGRVVFVAVTDDRTIDNGVKTAVVDFNTPTESTANLPVSTSMFIPDSWGTFKVYAWLIPMQRRVGVSAPNGYIFSEETGLIEVPANMVLGEAVDFGNSIYIGQGAVSA